MANDRALDEIRREAYDKAVAGWHWVCEFAAGANPRSRTYLDDYTRLIGAGASPGVMPVAEVLMCLVNTTEPVYRQLALPQPEAVLLKNAVADLLAAYAKRSFSGWPYVHIGGEDTAGDFTDAVCYVAGALVRVLRFEGLDLETRQRSKALLQTCVRWLLDARIKVAFEEQAPGFGWSWSSPNIREEGIYKNQLPPQTYFSTQVMTTLAEVLFDGYDHVPDEAVEILRTLEGAKQFLLRTLHHSKGTDRSVGWIDFDQDIAKSTGATGIQSYAFYEKKYGEPVRELSLYALEALSYVSYYAKDSSYIGGSAQVALQELGSETAQLLESFFRFEPDDRQGLAQAFVFAMGLLEDDLPFTSPCQIELPEPLNLNKDEQGLRSTKRVAAAKSWYVDGTVMYNLINTGNFYLRYADSVVDKEGIQLWRKASPGFIARVLERGFARGAFTHVSPFEGEDKPPVIYATRAAVASLLSWGPAAPNREVLPPDIRDLIARLYDLAGLTDEGKHPVNVSEPAAGGGLSDGVVRQLLSTGFLAGSIAASLDRVVSDPTRWPSFFPNLKTDGPELEEVHKTNGAGLVSRLALILSGDKSIVLDERAQLLKAKHVGRIHYEVMMALEELPDLPPLTRIERVVSGYRDGISTSQEMKQTRDSALRDQTEGI